jgi:hypothetical protein
MATEPETLTAIPRANVLGVGVSAINLDMALAHIARALQTRTKGYICSTRPTACRWSGWAACRGIGTWRAFMGRT